MPKQKRHPKNGSYLIALLVGGDMKFQNAVKEHVATFGVYIKYKWPTNVGQVPIDKRSIPDGLDVVIILRDNKMSRHERDRLTHNVKNSESWVINPPATHKAIVQELDQAGFSGSPLNVDFIEGRAPEVTTPVLPPDFEMENLISDDNIEPGPSEHHIYPPDLSHSAVIVEGESMPTQAEKQKQQQLTEMGAKIRAARQREGYSAADVSRLLKGAISSQAILNAENGKPTSTAMIEIFELLYKMPAGSLPRLGGRDNHILREAAKKHLIGFGASSKVAEQAPPSNHAAPVAVEPVKPSETLTVNPPPEAHVVTPTVGIVTPHEPPIPQGGMSEFLIKVAWLQGEFKRYGITKVELTTTRVVIEQQDAIPNS